MKYGVQLFLATLLVTNSNIATSRRLFGECHVLSFNVRRRLERKQEKLNRAVFKSDGGKGWLAAIVLSFCTRANMCFFWIYERLRVAAVWNLTSTAFLETLLRLFYTSAGAKKIE